MAETIYKHRKKLIKKKEDKTNQLIKITLLHLREPIKNQVVFSLISKMELAEILGLIEHFEYHTKFGEADNESNCKVWFIYLVSFSLPFPPLNSFSVVCAKKSLTVTTLFVCHHLRAPLSQKISDLKLMILFFTIYFSRLNKVYAEIQSRTTLLLKWKHINWNNFSEN